MKKIIAILAIMMLVPFTAFGLEALSEDVLDDVTGQAGVSIAVDVNIDATMDVLAWGDDDGLGAGSAATDGGWVGMTDFSMDNLRIKLREDVGMGIAGSLMSTGDNIANETLQFFTIDVASDPTGVLYGGATFVRIGLGTTQITMDSMVADVKLQAGATAEDMMNSTEQLGSISMRGLEVLIGYDSRVDIFAHDGGTAGGSGVTIDLDVTLDEVNMASMAWGDSDGLGTDAIAHLQEAADNSSYTDGGFIGIKDLAITGLTITGQILIDVATINPANAVAGLADGSNNVGMYGALVADGGDVATTGVIIQMNALAIGMETMSLDVVVNATDDFSAVDTGNTLGSMYIQNMNATIDGWVAITAH